MAISRQKKEEIVSKIQDIVKNKEAIVFVNFHGLSVENVNEMRESFREKGIGYTVAKKTLIKRVLGESGFEGEMPALNGELALAYAEDQVLPSQGVKEAQKKYKDAVSPLGGILEKRYINKEEVLHLASIPGREVLYGQFATIINAPIQQTVQVLNGVTESFVRALSQIAEQKS